METGNFWLWLAWACFGSSLALLLWKLYLPRVLQGPPPSPKLPAAAPPAWLFCEDGSALDQRVRWFPLRPGGRTVVGGRPRSATPEAQFVYLTADDILEDHVVIDWDGEAGRYRVESLGAGVQHNNEPLPPGPPAGLADGDTLDLGRVSRFRFTLTGPEES